MSDRETTPDASDVAAAPWPALHLDGRWRPPLLLDQTGSTNDDLIAWATRSPPPLGTWTLVAARQQRAGRGRRGRRWWSAPGGSLLFTVATRLQLPARCWPRASLVVGDAVARGLESALGVSLGLRWPNDLMSREAPARKVGGVLCERVELPGGAALWVAGVGLNVRPLTSAAGAPDLAAHAVGLDTLRRAAHSQSAADGVHPTPEVDVPTLLAPLARAIADDVDAWQRRAGRLLADRLSARLLFRDAEVGLDLGDGSRSAYWLDGVDDTGALRVRRVTQGAPTGAQERVVPLRLLDARTDPPWHHPPALAQEPG